MDSPNCTVTRHDLYAFFPSLDKRLQDHRDGGVEELVRESTLAAIRDTLSVYLVDGEISYEDTRVL